MRTKALLIGAFIALVCASSAHADSGVVASWNFDEGSGAIAHDVSGHGNDGTLAGVTEWTQGYFGSALSFDGGSAAVRVNGNSGLEPTAAVSVASWVQATGPAGHYKYILSKSASSCKAASYGLYTGANGGLQFYVSQHGAASYTTSPDAGTGIWDGRWHFVVGTYDGSSVRLYVDGKEVGHGSPLSGSIDYNYPDNDLFIGHYNRCPALNFEGLIDEIQVLGRAMTPAQVADAYTSLVALHDGNITTPPPGPLPALLSPPPPPTEGSSGNAGGSGSSGGGNPGHSSTASISKIIATGLGTGAPRVTFTVSGAVNDKTPITSFTVSLPAGLSFSHKAGQLRKGVTLHGAGDTSLSLRDGKLLVVLRRPTHRLSLTISNPALVENEALARRIALLKSFNRGKQRVLKLKLVLTLTDMARDRASVNVIVSLR
ncbi:MAG: LamG domain-containing protein [Solirubrobacteraceae bacterium]